ncbi:MULTISPECIES: TetR/AcrR family transcriptional regulator [Microbacterium]|uniref:TetR/AcrR family transcriptional regulator n=1 Tax=Microbacterium TaxID=33882 RepID=UPI000D64CECC|nr:MULTISPECIES: TetR/AcrR family transcriptional regulator [Microbacterium]
MRARAQIAEQTRSRILACARQALLEMPFDKVTLPLVAAAAEVTVQTVRNHFQSKEGLLRALADMLSESLRDERGSTPVDAAGAAAALASQYEHYGRAYAGLVAAAENSLALAAMIDRGRREHMMWLEQSFARHLPPDGSRRERALAALYAATDVGTWRLIRIDLGNDAETTVDAMTVLIDGAIAFADASG